MAKTVAELNLPAELKYTDEHIWARVEGDEIVVGVSDYAQDQLGEVVYVDVPGVGDSFDGGTGLDNGSSSSGGSSNPHPGRDYNYYKTQYDRWARNAKSVYESLTLMGSKTKTDGKYTSGNTNQLYNGPSYVSMKQNLRHAQTQMRNYRQEARRAGHNIPKSEYETVTVSY